MNHNKKDVSVILEQIKSKKDLTLELGCGNRKRIKNSIGIDILDYSQVDIVGNALSILKEIPSDTVGYIFSHHFLEHVAEFEKLFAEITRVLKCNGVFESVVPHFSNPYYYSDSTHKNNFGLYTFSYFAEDKIFRRGVHDYKRKFALRIISVDLIFKSPRPFYIRYSIKKAIQYIFNINAYTKEFYEENLCYIFPCYEIKYKLQKF